MKRREREFLLAGILVFVAILAVSATRRHLFAGHRKAKVKHDVYFLPAPEQVVVMSLGYRHALADVLWAHVMVSQGLHSFQQRRFENLVLLYDAINLLDPDWRTPYLLADALITFQANITPYEEVVKARQILERGAKQRPHDAEIWLNLGQFVSFIAPASYLADRPEEGARWRLEGVAYLERAAELGGANSNISWQALGGANILDRDGQRDASIRFMQRMYTVTDDEELKQKLLRRLRRMMTERDFDAYLQRAERFRIVRERELPNVRLNQSLALGPPPRPSRCAGAVRRDDPACATSWRQWSERYEESLKKDVRKKSSR